MADVLTTDYIKNISLVAEDGRTYGLMGGVPNFFVSLTGIGPATVRRIQQKAPLQHGSTDRGFRLEPRRMTLTLALADDWQNQALLDTRRDKLAMMFGPTNAAMSLKVIKLDGTTRQIDCYLDGGVDYPITPEKGAKEIVIIPLIAPDPSFYDPTQQTTTSVLSDGVTTNIDFTAIGLTWEDWPIIDLTGPLTTLQIQHTPGDELLRLSQAIPALETFRIDLRPGRKTVRRTSDQANRMHYINVADIGSFSLMRVLSEKAAYATNPTWVINRFGLSNITGATGATQATVSWYKRYLSL